MHNIGDKMNKNKNEKFKIAPYDNQSNKKVSFIPSLQW